MKIKAYMRTAQTGQKQEIAGEYIAMMPLRKNVPEPANKGWTLTTCKGCGSECWYQEKNAAAAKAIYPKIRFLCTECALKEGARRAKA